MLDVKVTDEVFASLKQHFDTTQIVELTSAIATYNMVARFLVALGVSPEMLPRNGKATGWKPDIQNSPKGVTAYGPVRYATVRWTRCGQSSPMLTHPGTGDYDG